MVKPRLSVSMLLDRLYPREHREELAFHGRVSHSIVYDLYRKRCGDIEVEKSVELDRGSYILVGRIDIVDHCSRRILEVKPARQLRIDARARMQLSAYVAMYRIAYRNYYSGAFLVYDWSSPEKYYIVRPFYLDLTVLDKLDRVAREWLGQTGAG